MPTFLMFGVSFATLPQNQLCFTCAMCQGGELVAVVRGALGPKLETTIKEKLAEEHQVLDGKKERDVVSDWF